MTAHGRENVDVSVARLEHLLAPHADAIGAEALPIRVGPAVGTDPPRAARADVWNLRVILDELARLRSEETREGPSVGDAILNAVDLGLVAIEWTPKAKGILALFGSLTDDETRVAGPLPGSWDPEEWIAQGGNLDHLGRPIVPPEWLADRLAALLRGWPGPRPGEGVTADA